MNKSAKKRFLFLTDLLGLDWTIEHERLMIELRTGISLLDSAGPDQVFIRRKFGLKINVDQMNLKIRSLVEIAEHLKYSQSGTPNNIKIKIYSADYNDIKNVILKKVTKRESVHWRNIRQADPGHHLIIFRLLPDRFADCDHL